MSEKLMEPAKIAETLLQARYGETSEPAIKFVAAQIEAYGDWRVQQATQPPSSDDGWVRVPGEPTREMQKAYFDAIDKNLERVSTDPRFGRFDNHREAYRAMLSAAPSGARPRT